MRILETQTKSFCTVSKHFPLQCVPFCCFVYIPLVFIYSPWLYICSVCCLFLTLTLLHSTLTIKCHSVYFIWAPNKWISSTGRLFVFILAFPLICHICNSAVKSVFSAAVKLVIGDCRHNKWAASWQIVWGPESNQTVQLLLAVIDAKFNSIRLSRRRGNVVPLV